MLSIKAQLKRKVESAQLLDDDDGVLYMEMCKYFEKQLGLHEKLIFDKEVSWSDVKTLFYKAKAKNNTQSSSQNVTPSTPNLSPDLKKKHKKKRPEEKESNIPDMKNTVSPDYFGKEF